MRRLLALWLALVATPAAAVPLEPYRHDRALALQVQRLALDAAEATLFRRPTPPLPAVDPRLRLPGAVFVTITRAGRTRGCWGSISPRTASLASEIRWATVQALRADHRHRPIARGEWPDLAFYVSLVGPLAPLTGAIAPARDGLYVTGPRGGGVMLPGEARTARYQLAACRRKAGLRPGEAGQLQRFPTLVFGPRGVVL